MLYEKEFQALKQHHARLPAAQREIVEVLAALPPLAVVVYGAVMVPLGIIGIGGLLALSVASTLASGLMIAGASGQLDAPTLMALPARLLRALGTTASGPDTAAAPQPAAAALPSAAPAASVTMQAPFNTAALRTVTAANDAAPKAPKVAAKGLSTAK